MTLLVFCALVAMLVAIVVFILARAWFWWSMLMVFFIWIFYATVTSLWTLAGMIATYWELSSNL